MASKGGGKGGGGKAGGGKAGGGKGGGQGPKTTAYHYTSPQHAQQIKQSGVIHPSSKGAFGANKVYMTTIPPQAGRKAIAKNNYDGGWSGRERQGNVDAVVKVRVDSSKLTRETDTGGRNIVTHHGPLKLDG